MKPLNLTILIAIIFLLTSCGDKDEPTPASSAITDCLPTNLQNNIVAYYPFGNGSLLDESGNNYDLINPTSAVPSTDRNGNLTCAYDFTSTDYLEYTNPTFLNNLNQISISLWYKSVDNDGGNFELLLGRENANGLHCPNTYGDFSLGLYDCNRPVFGYDQVAIWSEWPSFSTSCGDTLNYYKTNWNHLVGVYDNGVIKLYVNGVLTTETSSSTCGPIMLQSGTLKIGGNYKGLIDDIIIYDDVLNQNQITDLYNFAPCCYLEE